MVIVSVVVGLVAFIFLVIIFKFFGTWIRAWVSGAKVPLLSLVGMSLRRVAPSLIVDARIRLIKAGLSLNTDSLEAHYLAGGPSDRCTPGCGPRKRSPQPDRPALAAPAPGLRGYRPRRPQKRCAGNDLLAP